MSCHKCPRCPFPFHLSCGKIVNRALIKEKILGSFTEQSYICTRIEHEGPVKELEKRKQYGEHDTQTTARRHTDIFKVGGAGLPVHRQDGVHLEDDEGKQLHLLEPPEAVRQVPARLHPPGLFRRPQGPVQGALHRQGGEGLDGISRAAL